MGENQLISKSRFLPVSGYVYLFAQNIVQSTLYNVQHSLFDARDIKKKIKTHLFLQEFSQIYGNVSISFSGPFYPSRVGHMGTGNKSL